ncbi:PAS domain S-box protein [bacterium]|nr:PAS domain S-box protein [bacterium]
MNGFKPDTILVKIQAISTFIFFLAFANSYGSERFLTHSYTEIDGLPSSMVFNLEQDSKGVMWFLTRAGLASYDSDTWKIYDEIPNHYPSELVDFCLDEDDNPWVVSKLLHIHHFTSDGWKTIRYHDENNGLYRIVGMEFVYEGGRPFLVLAVDDLGLLVYDVDAKTWITLNLNDELPGNSIYSIDSENFEIQCVTDKGLFFVSTSGKIIESPFQKMLPPPPYFGLFHEKVRQDSVNYWLSGTDWIGFWHDNHFEYVVPKTKIAEYHDEKTIHLLPDGEGGVFFGNPMQLFHYSAYGISRLLDRDEGIVSDGCTDLLLDREMNYWISGIRGVSKIPSMQFLNYFDEDGLLGDEVTAIHEVSLNRFILGHNNGYSIFEDSVLSVHSFNFDEQTLFGDYSRVMDIEQDSQNNLWFAASQAGIFRKRSNGQLQQFVIPEKNASAWCLLPDYPERGEILVGTSVGIYLFRNQQFVKMAEISPFGVRNIFKSKDGTVYIASSPGDVLVVRNGKLVSNYKIPNREMLFYSFVELTDGTLLYGGLDGVFYRQNGEFQPYKIKGQVFSHTVYFMVEDHLKQLWLGTDQGIYKWDDKRLRHYTTQDGLSGLEVNRAAGVLDSNGKLWIGTSSGVSCYQSVYDNKETKATIPSVKITKVVVNGNPQLLNHPLTLNQSDNLAIEYRCISFIDESRKQFAYQLGIEHEIAEFRITSQTEVFFSNLKPGNYTFRVRAMDALERWSEVKEIQDIRIRKSFWMRWWFILLLVLFGAGLLLLIFHLITSKRYSQQLKREVELKTEQLQKSEEHFRSLVQDAVFGIFKVTDNGKFLQTNPALLEILDYNSEEELSSKNFFNDICKKLTAANLHDSATHSSNDIIEGLEATWFTKSGKSIKVRLSGRFVKNGNGGESGFELIVEDVTRQKIAEKRFLEAKKLESLGVLAGGIAHDFNNLLSVIIGNVDIASSSINHDHPASKPLKRIAKSVNKASDLTKKLLSYSGGAKSTEKNQMNLSKYIEEITDLIMILVPSHIKFTKKLQPELPSINGETSQMEQIILNLITNGVDAIGDQQGEISIITELTTLTDESKADFAGGVDATSGEYVMLQITDTGTGMDSDALSRIFEPFYTTKFVGRGLGLSAVLGIIRSYDGLIKVESRENQGTTFTVLFPVAST